MNQTYPCLKCGAMSASLHDPDCARAARTRSVEPPRDMIERAREWLITAFGGGPGGWLGWASEQQVEPLAAEFTAIRTQAIEMCAGVADKMQESAGHVLAEKHDDDAAAQHDTAMEIASAIRSLTCLSPHDKCGNGVKADVY